MPRTLSALVVGALALTAGLDPVSATIEPHSTPASKAAAMYAAMSPAQRVGQVFMVGVETTDVTKADLSHLQSLDIGNVILNGNSHRSLHKTAATNARIVTALTIKKAAPFISTDQEGGEVQRLTGKGFSAMPTALAQGKIAPSTLRADATTWARQLSRAGVTVNLAPVADTVPAKNAKKNQPIGQYDREYGHTPSVVGKHVVAFARGMAAGGVVATVKHFPGLGRATGNTDIQRHVTDPTTLHDSYLAPYQDAISAGAPFVMVSLATYPHIDPSHPACFSKTVMIAMLRHRMNFAGVIISDSFNAKAISNVSPANQAVRFFRSGGTMLLDTDPAHIHTMRNALLAEAKASKSFAATLKSAELAVLTAKAKAGLLS